MSESPRLANLWSAFAPLWGIAVVADQVRRGSSDDLTGIAIALFAIVLVVHPGRGATFLLLGSVQLFWYLSHFQEKAMVHWHLAACLHLGFILAFFEGLARNRLNLTAGLASARQNTMVLGRFILVVGFFFAGFAKLNTDFFDPELSCGVVYYQWLSQIPLVGPIIPMGSSATRSAPYIAASLEVLGPILLLSRRTRGLGLAVCWFLQLSLGINPRSTYYEFSGLFFAMGVFFLPENIPMTQAKWRTRLLQITGISPSVLHVVVRAVVATIAAGSLWASMIGMRAEALEVLRYVWCLLTLGPLAVLLAYFRRVPDNLTLFPRYFLPALVAGAFLVNEASPYFGLDHSPTLTMAANLRLTPGASNHLVFQEIPTFGPSTIVEIKRSSVPGIHRNTSYPYAAFVEQMGQARRGKVTFVMRGKRHEARAKDQQFSGGSLLARVMRLSAHSPSEAQRICKKTPPGFSKRDWKRHARDVLRKRRSEQ